MKNFLKLININDREQDLTKSRQLVKAILDAMQSGKLHQGDTLPSINDLCTALETSRGTIERAYNKLREMGAINSYHGKSYYIADKKTPPVTSILLLFSNLSIHKKIMFDSFSQTIGEQGKIDFYIYNNDYNLFKKLLTEKMDAYSKIVVVPQFTDNEEMAHQLIDKIPKEKLVLMGRLIEEMEGDFGAVYEPFKNDIYDSLKKIRKRLSKYSTIKMVFPEGSYYSREIINGFMDFCSDYTFDYELLADLEEETIAPNTAYITLSEDDLIVLIEKIIPLQLNVGKQVGILSYNESPLKKIILNGISTISSNFEVIGHKTAEIVLRNSTEKIPVPCAITLRKSL